MNTEKTNPYEIDIAQISKEDLAIATFIDVRESFELDMNPIEKVKAIHLPLSEIEYWDHEFDKDKKYFFICEKGMRSAQACHFLKDQGISNAHSIKGGTDAVNSLNL